MGPPSTRDHRSPVHTFLYYPTFSSIPYVWGNLKVNNLGLTVFGMWEHLEEAHKVTGRTCKFHTDGTRGQDQIWVTGAESLLLYQPCHCAATNDRDRTPTCNLLIMWHQTLTSDSLCIRPKGHFLPVSKSFSYANQSKVTIGMKKMSKGWKLPELLDIHVHTKSPNEVEEQKHW